MPVKKEAIQKEVGCVNASKKVSNAFTYKLKKAPVAVKKFYDKHINFAKMNSEEKKNRRRGAEDVRLQGGLFRQVLHGDLE